MDARPPLERLADLLAPRRRVLVLTGAGASTASGIPDYRGPDGSWKRSPPVTLRAFTTSEGVRRRYWARSAVGWPRVATARPNPAHEALAALEAAGRVHHVITQNVDRLHQRAGSRHVLDLHGRLDEVVCLGCGRTGARADVQAALLDRHPHLASRAAATAPDGDADLDAGAAEDLVVPTCPACGGLWKPAVVFFGENVPRARVEAAYALVAASDALLVVGSSLMVFSGYRFVRAAREAGLPVAILGLGCTRADDEATLKVEARCEEALPQLRAHLAAAGG